MKLEIEILTSAIVVHIPNNLNQFTQKSIWFNKATYTEELDKIIMALIETRNRGLENV